MMPVGATIAAVGGIAAAGIAGSAASSAAKTQAGAATQAANLQNQAANRAADLQMQMFNTIRGDLSPYRLFGSTALPGISQLLGLHAPSAAPQTVLGGSAFTGGGLAGGQGGQSMTINVNGTPMQVTFDPTSGTFTAGGLAGGAPQAPMKAGDINTAQLFQQRPDVLKEAQRVTGTGEFPSVDAYAQWWNQHYGQPAGYQAPTWTQDQIDALYPQAPPAAGGGQDPTAGNPLSGPNTSAPGSDPMAAAQDFLANTPGYQFAKQQGMQAVQNTLGARGLGGLSGSLGKGLARFVTGLADQTYQQQLDNYFRVAGIGQSAANQTGAFGSSAASGAGSNLVGGANALANGLIGSANANAAGTVGVANAVGGAINGGVNGYLTSQILGMYGGGGAYPASAVTGSQGALLGTGYGDFGSLFGGG